MAPIRRGGAALPVRTPAGQGSKTGDSRFESWLPRLFVRAIFGSAIGIWTLVLAVRFTGWHRTDPGENAPDRPKTGPHQGHCEPCPLYRDMNPITHPTGPATGRKQVRLALSKVEAAEALGISVDFLEEHVMHELRVVRKGRRRLIPVKELERWMDEQATKALD